MQISSELTYDDFEVEIGIGKGREYPIAVLHSAAGEARETMHFPYDELVLENRLKDLKIALLGSGGMRRSSLSSEEQMVQSFGSDLFNSLITGEVRNRYDVSLEKAKSKGRGLRVKLRIQPPNLAVLPWEFLYEPRQSEYMGLMRSISIVRYPEHPQPIQPLSVTLPLRILGMVVSPIDLPRLDINIEKQRVEESLKNLQENGLVELTWLEGQTWRDLQKAMRGGPWHIFHFVGHGGFDRSAGEGIIALADGEGRMRPFSATELSRLLADHYPLRLVILNSCEGARGSDRDLTSSTASILVRRGIPAVLGMQYKITDRAAIEFARTFYEALADGMLVDAAVAEARKAISIEVANTVEWGTPVLYMRSPDGVLFSIQKKKVKGRKRIKEEPISPEEKERLEQERREREARQTELSALYSKGTEALEAQDWQTAVEWFKEIIAIDADYRDASAKLMEAERQLDLVEDKERQRLEELYAKVVKANEAKNWTLVISICQEIGKIDPDYKNVATLSDAAKINLLRQEHAEKEKALKEKEEKLEEKKRDLELKEKAAKEAKLDAQKEAERLEKEHREREARQKLDWIANADKKIDTTTTAKYCYNCGYPNVDKINFCTQCGAKLSEK
ncbi:MAG TPA: CHAT domain-containing protein [Candidatus Methanoperedens sp.]|nr:CHAT domain-containing protein [Candidatus Methanoperedens sp.]HLB71702.1 CHAT domain-containing protein [Candidatus Methanoperedens sp.]